MTIVSGGVIYASDILQAHNSDGTHKSGATYPSGTLSSPTLSEAVTITGVLSPSSIGANQDDYNPTSLSTATTLRLTSSAAYNITGLAGGASGRVIIIHNVGSYALTLKDESSSSTAANRFALAADVVLNTDQSIMLQYDSTTARWRAMAYPVISKIVQVVNSQDGAVATGTTTIPWDDTIPQNTEGNQYLSVSITPTVSTNKLVIDVTVQLANSADVILTAALFQDSTAGALAAIGSFQSNGVSSGIVLNFRHYMTAGTTSATTFKVRAGGSGAGTTVINGLGSARYLGGVMASSITVTEVTV